MITGDTYQEQPRVVVGSRGRGAVQELMLGSVSLQCALHARCPVTVVHPEPVDADVDARPTR